MLVYPALGHPPTKRPRRRVMHNPEEIDIAIAVDRIERAANFRCDLLAAQMGWPAQFCRR